MQIAERMVLKRKLNCGFDIVNIPKAPRSIRRKVSSKRSDEDNQICAFDLLASLAGKLLEESESSSSTYYAFEDVKQELVNLAPNPLVESGGIKDEAGLATMDTGIEEGEAADGVIVDTFNGKDPTQFPDPDLKLPPGKDGVSNESSEGNGTHSKLVCRDDDENYCKYYKLSNKCKSYRRALYRKRKLSHRYKPWKHEAVHRKRRLSSRKDLVVNPDEDLSSGSVSSSPQKRESVKFSIKSLRIPELLIEVPKTATVGSVKRTVKEAVAALVAGGIHIGVLLQGKKLRDDNNTTLLQTGLSPRENLGNLGFTLEPGPEKLHVPPARSAGSPALDSRLPLGDEDHLIHSGDIVEKSHELVSGISADEKHLSDSRALVSVSALEPEAFAVVPVNEKPKRTEVSLRRTRRPFCVTEVEALVQAVEELGTGRWRDVKLRSFENASHRTYVDLKDKWKTLVHTASISPQQRRGEPVPQVLLGRVLEAHRHWSQQQAKQTGKHQVVAAMVVQLGSSM